ncbi:MAG TPA: glycosyltransferase family 4 protein [Acidobacteriota bacterium]|nr:glycosyltransferase family 4 protein [Acidobacteriota bacterium]
MHANRDAVFVAYNFPPHGGGGVQRSLKFVKYLPEFGWRPTVLTSSVDSGGVQDPNLLREIPPGIELHRVPAPSIRRLQTRCEAWKLGKPVSLLNLILQVPDADLLWALKARRTLDTIIREKRPELIYTTSGPYSSHLLGLWATSRYPIPWFADFRDPWSKNLVVPYLPGYRAINCMLERRVLARATRVACVSQPWLDDLQGTLGREAGKFILLPNGYDETDIEPLPSRRDSEKFTLTHLGSFYRNRRPFQLIEAVENLLSRKRIPTSQLRIVFVGKNARKYVPSRLPYEACDYVPHRELDRFRQATNVFLLILDTSEKNRGNYSGKVYELLAVNRPILAIVPKKGVAHQLIEETRTGVAITGDKTEIADAIERLYLQWKNGNGTWNPNWRVIHQYQRRKITAKLAEQFNQLAASGGSA